MNNIIRLLYLLLLIQLSSCHVQTTGFPLIYRSGNSIHHNDIIIQARPNLLTEYSSGTGLHVVSTWIMNGDTIIAVPKIEYGIRNSEFWYKSIDVTDSTVTSIRKTYILKGKKLEDITNYNHIFLLSGLTQTVDSASSIGYYRIK